MKNIVNKTKYLLLLGCLLRSFTSIAQDIELKKQTFRGYIIDRTTQNGISGAFIELLNHSPRISAISGENGMFELKNVPVGHQRVQVELVGYYETIHSQLVVAGKEAVATIALDEKVKSFVTVEAKRSKVKDKGRFRNEKMETVDEMNPISTRTFNIEEATKYVGAYGDPARIVTNFSGMFNIDDSQNFIVSRGNSPYGMQWMIEGVPVDNPNHLATMGNTGAIFPLLNNNLLDDSDFTNGALAAQYSNVYSGVFDVNLREGNNSQHEFMAQLSTFGAEFMAEGPFQKKGASYAVAVRAGIFDLIQLVGIDIGSNASPHYYDVNFKLDIPTKKLGHFSIFGIGGLSDVALLNEGVDSSDIFAEQGIDLYINANFGLVGVKHQKFFGKQTYLKTTLSYLLEDYRSHRDTIYPDSVSPYFAVKNFRQRIGLSSILNKKISSKFTFRLGAHGYLHFISIWDRWLQRDETHSKAEDIQVLASGFFQAQYKFSQRLVLTLGVQGMYWTLNKDSWAIEPRFALNWYLAARHKLSLGYGWHSRIQSFTMSFFVQKRADGTYDTSNRALGPTRSHHVVLAYDAYLAKFWGLRANLYALYNTNIPVLSTPSSLSIANHGAFSIYPELVGWESTGEGFGYGAELSIEKFFSQGYYGLLSGAYQRSFYKGSDEIWRNSAFDVQYIASAVMGKELKIGKKKRNIIYADLRFNLHGGLPYTPVDLEASRRLGTEVLVEEQAYTERLGVYRRIDIRLGARFNHRKKRISHHVYIEVLNVTNFKNDLQVKYNVNTEQIERAKQFGFLPNVFYQIRF
ncbi:TonB-dependent receptor [Aureispira anguillae]|uniref:TonB-dependent receptor n=1 Tax=Aureispira anguillae TaxID=2864201 RepID=A0A915YAB8_9BACT|nr:TonB-dependent receptor [Aureispira anguillae]BDS09377.1 TonB-dependent receptor [Aureispira anguillae]